MSLISVQLSNLLNLIAEKVGSFGLSIIIITLCLKIILAPLNVRQMKISKLMNAVNKEVSASLETRKLETQEEESKIRGEMEDSLLPDLNQHFMGQVAVKGIDLQFSIIILFVNLFIFMLLSWVSFTKREVTV
ncbi:hypothetical protein P6P90_12670 [Ectobacillus antri]|uniref:Membrane protein insertase YidC n=1 Tax=Ectobacillus antri TaxID=2486280 RepID=A0ABT6H633_9BACI|nr:hypothetical protein [Ectobacillus antri]MDG4657794.1 hypothetical protein [Ectobacillus antri]MDG5754815.1 hypothetical protein [Ectobacillus antri]